MLKTICTFCFTLFLFADSFAQPKDSICHFRFKTSGTLNQTNDSKAYLLGNSANFDISRKKIDFSSTATWLYGQQSHELSNNDFFAGATLDFGKGKQALYEWALANYQTSYSLKIGYKVQTGSGIGFTILDSPKTKLSISDGFLYEANNLSDPDLGKDVYSTVRNSFRLKYKLSLKDGKLSLNGVDFVQPSILSISDYILNFNNDINYQITKWLNINATLFYNRVNRSRRENLFLQFGFSIDKYF